MGRVENAYSKVRKVLDEVGGELITLPDGDVVRVIGVVHKGRLDRVEVRRYNRVSRPSGEGRPQVAEDSS